MNYATYWNDMKKRNEYLKTCYSNSDLIPTCPKCKSKEFIIPCIKGLPTGQILRDAEENYVKISGCASKAKGYCVKCKELILF
ncbi:hypothetical protein ABK040_014586 [Willaertia magna]